VDRRDRLLEHLLDLLDYMDTRGLQGASIHWSYIITIVQSILASVSVQVPASQSHPQMILTD
jgi:hypothetical protein